MLIKLGIITGIVILAGMIFFNEIDILFPTTSASVFDSLKDDMSNLGAKTSDTVDKTSSNLSNELTEIGEKISNEISEVKDSSQNIINEEISNIDFLDSITDTTSDDTTSDDTTSDDTTSDDTTSDDTTSDDTTSDDTTSDDTTSDDTTSDDTTSDDTTNQENDTIIYETLSLSTIHESDDNILLQYSDSSGKTTSVNVKIRTDQKEIFSGTFYTSMFETIVNDASGVPYYVDMIVDHQEYGIVTSSVFNSGDNSDSKINGMFSQS